MASRIIAVGAVSAGLAVALGAFGAHALEERITSDMLDNWETGTRYHFYHSLGMICVGLLARVRRPVSTGDDTALVREESGLTRLRLSAALMLTGIVLFSGSLYTMAITDLRWLGAITPFGGVAFLGAWALLVRATLYD